MHIKVNNAAVNEMKQKGKKTREKYPKTKLNLTIINSAAWREKELIIAVVNLKITCLTRLG